MNSAAGAQATSPPAPGAPPLWYTLAWLLALPAVALYLLWRSVRQPEYRQHWGERFLGRGPAFPTQARGICFWVHAVSVGETRAAYPLVQQLAMMHDDARFLLTHLTPTGRAAGADLVRALPGRVVQRYLPYDLPFAVARFLRETRPGAGVLMETEIWPQLLGSAHAADIPVVLANARLSRRSLAKALRHPTLLRRAAAAINAVGAQTAADRDRIAQLYAGPVEVTGNGKFDITPDATLIARGRDLRKRLRSTLGERPIWLFASTREGEEKLILDAVAAHPQIAAARPLLLFVPRHPQRFDTVAGLLRETGAAVLRRAQWDLLPDLLPDLPPHLPPESPPDALRDGPQDAPRDALADASRADPAAATILLGDSMGEMALYYAMADAALIGGSLLPLGGQNLIEACACGCPVVLGPHMFNFAAAAADAVAAGAARAARNAGDVLDCLLAINADPAARQAMAMAGLDFAHAHQGATARTVALIHETLRSALNAAAVR